MVRGKYYLKVAGDFGIVDLEAIWALRVEQEIVALKRTLLVNCGSVVCLR
jgi:hypothetical protein